MSTEAEAQRCAPLTGPRPRSRGDEAHDDDYPRARHAESMSRLQSLAAVSAPCGAPAEAAGKAVREGVQ